MIIQIVLIFLFTAIISYLLGSLNSAIIVCKLWKKVDIREHGSKNAGLTNTMRVFGKGPAAVTLAGDLLKGILAVVIARLFANAFDVFSDTVFIGYIAGIFAMLGHIFPVYYKFKGGKGVLVAASILIAVDPFTFCIIIPFFAIIILITKYVSVASICAALFYPILTLITQTFREYYNPVLNASLAFATGIIIILMHKSNIERLENGTENKFIKK